MVVNRNWQVQALPSVRLFTLSLSIQEMRMCCAPVHYDVFRVLYAFLVSRHEYREAAAAMMAYAWRMRTEASRTAANVQETLLAYGERGYGHTSVGWNGMMAQAC